METQDDYVNICYKVAARLGHVTTLATPLHSEWAPIQITRTQDDKYAVVVQEKEVEPHVSFLQLKAPGFALNRHTGTKHPLFVRWFHQELIHEPNGTTLIIRSMEPDFSKGEPVLRLPDRNSFRNTYFFPYKFEPADFPVNDHETSPPFCLAGFDAIHLTYRFDPTRRACGSTRFEINFHGALVYTYTLEYMKLVRCTGNDFWTTIYAVIDDFDRFHPGETEVTVDRMYE